MSAQVTIEAMCARCEEPIRREDVRIKTRPGSVHGRCVAGPWPRACRACGCTDAAACITDAGPCWWVEGDLCSACAPGADERHRALPHAANAPVPRKRSQERGEGARADATPPRPRPAATGAVNAGAGAGPATRSPSARAPGQRSAAGEE